MRLSRRGRRVGPQSAFYSSDVVRVRTWSVAFGIVALALTAYFTNGNWTAATGAGVAVALVVRGITMRISNVVGDTIMHALQPSGTSTPYEKQYSYQDALAAKGDIEGAIASYEALLAEDPADAAARIRVADLYARKGGDPHRAAEHFRAVQRLDNVPPERLLYASNRLVDLYMGALDDEGKAMVELRKIIDRFPGSTVAQQARSALARLKSARQSG